MPIKPHKGERKNKFISRCIEEVSKSKRKRPIKQKVAICFSEFRKK